MVTEPAGWKWTPRPLLYAAGVIIWLCFLQGSARELKMIRPTAVAPVRRRKPRAVAGAVRIPLPSLGAAPTPPRSTVAAPIRPLNVSTKLIAPRSASSAHIAPRSAGSVPIASRGALVQLNRTVFQLPSGQCIQRAVALPSLCCSLPRCNKTQDNAMLLVLTNQKLRKWVGYLRFELDDLPVRSGARCACNLERG